MDNLTGLTQMRGITSHRITRWLEAGYSLFIDEGQYGINVEQLAKALGRNKSAFYHFFGDKETFMEFLFDYHMTKVDSFIEDMKVIDEYDPHYIHLLIKHHRIILFNSQLIKNSRNKLFENALHQVNMRMDECILPIWTKYVGLEHNPDLSKRYHTIIRDYMFVRITPELCNYSFLSGLAGEARLLVTGLVNHEKILSQVTIY
jgi:AcrR family transcriptional regulator